MSEIPEGYLRRITSTIPFGYELSDIQGWLQPIEDQINSLSLIANMIVIKVFKVIASERLGA